jgi:hypothetical protein
MSAIPPVPVKSEMTEEAYYAARKEYVNYVCLNLRRDEAEAAMTALYNSAKPSAEQQAAEDAEFERWIDAEQADAARVKTYTTAMLEQSRAEVIDIERRLALRKPGTIRILKKELKAGLVKVATLVGTVAHCDYILESRSNAARVINDRRSR